MGHREDSEVATEKGKCPGEEDMGDVPAHVESP